MNGYRLILDHLCFLDGTGGESESTMHFRDPGASVPSQSAENPGTSGLYQTVVRSLNQALSPRDRLQVFLSDGKAAEDTIYGSGEENTGLWGDASKPEDQTFLFEKLRTGDRITLYGKCTQPEASSNPGQFDSRLYCLARRIVLKMSTPQERGIQRVRGNPLRSFWLWYRNKVCDMRIGMQEGLLSVFGREDAAQIAAFVLGDGSGMDSGTRKLFRDGGLSWLVCVSSLHISLLGMMIYRFLRAKGIGFLPSAAASLAVAASYAMMTGFSLSAQRALVTLGVWSGAQIFGRTRDTLSALSLAAVLILAGHPLALWDSSFLLSCICILSLEYLTPAVRRVLKPEKAVQRKICSSAALWIGSFPAVLWFFYQTTPYASLVYPVMLPLMALFLGFGILGSSVGYLFQLTRFPLFLTLGRTLGWPCRILLLALRFVCSLEQDLPGSVLILGRPSPWQVVAYYVCLSVFIAAVRNRRTECFGGGGGGVFFFSKGLGVPLFHKRKSVKRTGYSLMRVRAFSAAVLGFLVWMVSLRVRPAFRFTCLDVGQGSCSLIEHGSCVCLFDAGSSSVNNVWQYRIDSTLKYYGIRKIDVVFLSHGDLDHINGIGQMLDQYHRNLAGHNAGDVSIGQILIPNLPYEQTEAAADCPAGDRGSGGALNTGSRLDAICKAAMMHNIRVRRVQERDCLIHDDMTMEILNPSMERITGNSNEDCIVMALSCRSLRILYMGDLEKEGEEMFVRAWKTSQLFLSCAKEKGSDDNTIILVAGHHGSRNATSKELLDMVKPDLALISCGKNNRYGHPAPAVLERLKEAGSKYRRTDLEGAIQVAF